MRDTGMIAHDSPQFIPKKTREGGYPAVAFNGTGAGIRAEALDEVGHYPWEYFLTFLELHLCTRLIEAGWEVRLYPELEVWHSRQSGSTYPARDYSGLRNYYLYVLEFYPWAELIYEVLHEIGYRTKLVLSGYLSIRLLISATYGAIRSYRWIIRARRPVSAETIRYLKEVRKCGNWHQIAPERRTYSKLKPEEVP
jgi:GT2 family glycosyltransferase